MGVNYSINEGNFIGSENTSVLGAIQNQVKASAAVTKGQLIEVTGNWTVGPAADNSAKVCGIAGNTAAIGEKVVIDTEGFVKLDASNAVITAGDKVVSAGAGKVKKMVFDTTATVNQTTVNAAITASTISCGVVIAGCLANGVAFVKFSI